ncbi:MAG TPA: hypothetical protein VG317_06555 [Pseudonocardiaceae bacterium]|nr:hypothetical protein [Pseudonocardiaceae bacterium]
MTEPPPRRAVRGTVNAVNDISTVFGDVLPDTTADEREQRPDGVDQDAGSDAWHRAQRPPHHDRA